jgi:hypothetical protein
MQKIKKLKPRFKVGDWVSFPFGIGNAVAQVIEDRGQIGVKGRRLYRVERHFGEYEPDRFEVPEENMTHAAPPETAARAS